MTGKSKIVTKFSVSDTSVEVIRMNPDNLTDKLPSGIYKVASSMFGMYLTKHRDHFDVPDVLFGDTQERVNKLYHRYEITGQVSALLTGKKGAGKSLLSAVFGNMALDHDKPVILVEDSFGNVTGLKTFLHSLGDAVFIFDEFAKTFGKEQDGMLDFFSGANVGKRAVFLIDNEVNTISQYILQRPGRVRFHYDYGKLDINVVKQVCEYNNLPEHIVDCVVSYSARVYDLTMDTLSRIVEECLLECDNLKTQDDFNKMIAVLNVSKAVNENYILNELKFNNISIPIAGVNARVLDREVRLKVDLKHPCKLLEAIKDADWFKRLVEDCYFDDDDDEKYQIVNFTIPLKFNMGAYNIYTYENYGLSAKASVDLGYMDLSYKQYLA